MRTLRWPWRSRLRLKQAETLPVAPQIHEVGVAYLDSSAELEHSLPPIQQVLAGRLGLETSSERFCPVLLADATAVILVREGWHDSDQVAELERLLVHHGYCLGNPVRVVVPVPLLLAIARRQLPSQGGVVVSPSALERRGHILAAFHDMVAWGFDHDASDLHINIFTAEPVSEVRFSIAGRYVAPERYARMPTTTLLEILAVAWMDIQGGNGAVFDPRIEQQGRLRLEVRARPVMLRWASLATDAGPSVCLRLLRLDARTDHDLAGLGFLPEQCRQLERACAREGGAVVLAGVVGSGKSTTIATLMGTIPSSHKVITLEDPVEYRIPGALQSTVARSLDDQNAGAFDAKLKTIKRSAMQDLLVGEVRDQDTARAFTDLAGSGISVYTTVHAGSAILIPDRLASDFIGISRDFLATPGVLKLLVYQSLLPQLCPVCALDLKAWLNSEPESASAMQAWVDSVCVFYELEPGGLRFRNPAGCSGCQRANLPDLLGWQGRTVVAEVIEPGEDDVFLRNLRAADNVAQRRHWRSQRQQPFHQAGMAGKTALECAIYKASQGWIDLRDIAARFGDVGEGGRHV